MPAHLKANKYGYYYLVDGFINKSLRTKSRAEAEARLKQYNQGKYILKQLPTVGEYYRTWMARKIEPLYRRGQIREYKYQFKLHILPRFEQVRLSEVRTRHLRDFQVELLGKGLAVKTVRNIVDGSFRALYRDARADHEELEGRDPFIDVEWPKVAAAKPDPFTAEERDRIIQHWVEADFFSILGCSSCFTPVCGQAKLRPLPGRTLMCRREPSRLRNRATWEPSRLPRRRTVTAQSKYHSR